MRRTRNHDAFLVMPAQRAVAVADGGGQWEGPADGAVVVADAVREIFGGVDDEPSWAFPRPLDQRGRQLIAALKLANQRLWKRPQEERATASAAALAFDFVDERAPHAFVAHVGDCRAWRWRDAVLEQLTRDHTLLEQFLAEQRATAAQLADFPARHVITRSIGVNERVLVDVAHHDVHAGDVFVLTTNGVTREGILSTGRLEELIEIGVDNDTPAGDIARSIVDAALYSGKPDNTDDVAVVVVRVLP